MTTANTPAADLSLAQLVQTSGINNTRPDETVKIPSQVEEMIAATNRQLELVTGQIDSLDEMSKRISTARNEKTVEKYRLEKVLTGLHDARSAMAKP